jgi:hypothetical protein
MMSFFKKRPEPVMFDVRGVPSGGAGRPTARQALAATIKAVAEAERDAKHTAVPVNRLAPIIAGHDQAVAELEALRQADAVTLGAWLAEGSRGQRPEPSPATLAAEQHLAELIRDDAAAAAAMPEHRARAEAAAARVQSAIAQRDAAVRQVAMEAVKELVTGELLPALRTTLACEALLLGVRDELREAGVPHDAGLTADAVVAAIRAPGLGRDTLAWRRLQDAFISPPAGALVAEALLQGVRDAGRAANTASVRGFLAKLARDPAAKLDLKAA